MAEASEYELGDQGIDASKADISAATCLVDGEGHLGYLDTHSEPKARPVHFDERTGQFTRRMPEHAHTVSPEPSPRSQRACESAADAERQCALTPRGTRRAIREGSVFALEEDEEGERLRALASSMRQGVIVF